MPRLPLIQTKHYPLCVVETLYNFPYLRNILYMENTPNAEHSLDDRIASGLKTLRTNRGWSLDELSKRCNVSRATLSRLEKGEVSPTATVLGKLCSAHALTMSRLMAMVETEFDPFVPRSSQIVWQDPETGFRRRSVSPPAETLAGEIIECEIPPGTRIEYAGPSRPGLEHHLMLVQGRLAMTVDGQSFQLRKGDCLRYQLFGPSVFETGQGQSAKYILAMM